MGNFFQPTPSSPLWDPYPTWKYTPQDLRKKLRTIQSNSMPISQRRKFRIVICACGRDGKSSSINNLLAALENKYSQPANVGSEDHVTKSYREYPMSIGQENDNLYVICDTPGLRAGVSQTELEVQTEAIKAAILGKFRHEEEMMYSNLTVAELKAKIIRQKCAVGVIFVIDIRKVVKEVIDSSSAFVAMKAILDFAQNKNISVSCLLTHCDELDANVKNDMRKIYGSNDIERARQMVEKKFCGFPGNRIFPIVNYTDRLYVTEPMMVQSLFALNHIMSDILSNLKAKEAQERFM